MVRRLMPCWLTLVPNTSAQLMLAIFLSYCFTIAWREANPSYDVSSDDIGYAAGWFVTICTVALLFSTAMANLSSPESMTILAWILVLNVIGIFTLIGYMGYMHEKIDAVVIVYEGESEGEAGAMDGAAGGAAGEAANEATGGAGGTSEAGSTRRSSTGGNVKRHKRKVVSRGAFGVQADPNAALLVGHEAAVVDAAGAGAGAGAVVPVADLGAAAAGGGRGDGQAPARPARRPNRGAVMPINDPPAVAAAAAAPAAAGGVVVAARRRPNPPHGLPPATMHLAAPPGRPGPGQNRGHVQGPGQGQVQWYGQGQGQVHGQGQARGL